MDERINIPADVFMKNFAHKLFFLQRCLHIVVILKRDLFQSVDVVVIFDLLAIVVLTSIEDSVNDPKAALAEFG